MKRSSKLRALAVLGAIGLALLLAEIAARVWSYRDDARSRAAWSELERPEGERMFETGSLRDMLRLSENPRIVYELRPNLALIHNRQPVTTNEAGLRGPLVALEKPPGTRRIVGLGDSVMFAWGVDYDESYMALLAEALASDLPEPGWEVINTAVPGYNTVMEVAALEEKGLAYEPDLVLLHFIGNDLGLPNFIRHQRDYLALDTSFLADRLLGSAADVGDMVQAPRREIDRAFERRPERVPEEYRHLVGRDAYTGAMRRLAELREIHGFELLVVAMRAPGYVERACRRLSIPLLEVVPAMQAHMDEHGIDDYAGSELTVSESDPHPSAVGHRIYFEEIHRWLDEGGILARSDSSG